MKRFVTYCIFVLAMISMTSSCSELNLNDNKLEYEFNADWASVCYYGQMEASGLDRYSLTLIQGRIDADDNLISTGAILNLSLEAPVTNSSAIPIGTYKSITEGAYDYYFNNNSYLAVRFTKDGEVKKIKIDSGSVYVTETEGRYEIKSKFNAGGLNYSFSYSGAIPAFDFSSSL